MSSNEESLTKKIVDLFERFVRDIITAVSTLDLATRDLDMIQQVFLIRRSRAGLAGTIAAKEGVMKVNQCEELYFIC